MTWNEFAKFYDWEFEMICTNQRHDVKIWKKLAAKYGGPILDVCCGSGRITQELAKMGFEITALDYSQEMLNILESKQLPNVQTVLADMTDFSLDQKFKFIFISYSSFQQLLSEEDQIKCFETIKRHLTDDGVLAFDLNPNVCEGPDILENEIAYIADYPANNSRVTMFTSHKIDRTNQIKHWKDTYVEVDGNRREFVNYISLKECSKNHMKQLFEKTGYRIIDVFGDFEGGKVTKDSDNLIYVAKHKSCLGFSKSEL
jgi:trans-aconitate methyltransferase